jgi:hypothetical protein
MEALATAAVKALLKFLTSQSINTLLALCAFISLMCWLISDGHAGDPATWCCAWVLHFAAMSSIDIRKGGAEL